MLKEWLYKDKKKTTKKLILLKQLAFETKDKLEMCKL